MPNIVIPGIQWRLEKLPPPPPTPELFHSGIAFLLHWSISKPLRKLGHSSFSQKHSRKKKSSKISKIALPDVMIEFDRASKKRQIDRRCWFRRDKGLQSRPPVSRRQWSWLYFVSNVVVERWLWVSYQLCDFAKFIPKKGWVCLFCFTESSYSFSDITLNS